jgi:23S rRNA (uracil1939-C5)-methyltransferase
LDLLIEKLVYGGEGLARDNGKVVLTPFVLPGEQVVVSSVTQKKDLVRARATEVRQPSPHRTTAPCRHFETCGGCAYQHAQYAYEVEQKVEILREVLRRVGKFDAPADIATVTGPEWEYRNRVQLHFDGRRLGFHEAGSHEVVGVERCPISSPTLNQAITRLQALSKSRRWPEFLRTFELFTNEEQTLFNVTDSGPRRVSRSFFEWVNGEVPGALESALHYDGFRVSHRSFFQVNRFLIQSLVETALGDVRGETCLDLYAGVGLFTRALVDRFAKVTAVEAVQSAVADLVVNVPGATVVRRPVEASPGHDHQLRPGHAGARLGGAGPHLFDRLDDPHRFVPENRRHRVGCPASVDYLTSIEIFPFVRVVPAAALIGQSPGANSLSGASVS